jgi:hypothetical protein
VSDRDKVSDGNTIQKKIVLAKRNDDELMPNYRRSATTVRWSPSWKCNVTRKIRERKMNTLICGSIIMFEIALVFM